MSDRFLGIYLNDHLAGATTGLELARRACSSNDGTELGRFLEELVEEIAEDRATLVAVMDRLGIVKNPMKQLAGWSAEKFGRLKLNGQLIGYSPLSRLVELEFLYVGITGKLGLWRALEAGVGGDLPQFDFPQLIARAEAQRARVEEFRLQAAKAALSHQRASA
jgi:hypothetical protein